MSYICLLANSNGAVVAGESQRGLCQDPFQLTSPDRDHWSPGKCHAAEKTQLIWAQCGYGTFHGVETSTLIRAALDSEAPMSLRLNNLIETLAPHTSYVNADGHTGGYGILIAYREKGRTHLRHLELFHGKVHSSRHWVIRGTGALFCHDGMHTTKVSLPTREEMEHLSFSQLRALARKQVQKAIDYDAMLDEQDLNYTPAVGGKITTCGLRPLDRA